jgi:hypothetical protein
MINKICVDIERQNIKANMKEKLSLMWCCSLKGKEEHIEISVRDEERGVMSWKVRLWGLKGIRKKGLEIGI